MWLKCIQLQGKQQNKNQEKKEENKNKSAQKTNKQTKQKTLKFLLLLINAVNVGTMQVSLKKSQCCPNYTKRLYESRCVEKLLLVLVLIMLCAMIYKIIFYFNKKCTHKKNATNQSKVIFVF